MEEMAKQSADKMFQYGALGVVAFLLICGVVWLIWNMNKRHAEEHAECREDRQKSREEIKAISTDYHEQSTQNLQLNRQLLDGFKTMNEGQRQILDKMSNVCQWNGSERRR